MRLAIAILIVCIAIVISCSYRGYKLGYESGKDEYGKDFEKEVIKEADIKFRQWRYYHLTGKVE